MDIVNEIMEFEDGQMDDDRTIRFFAKLVKSGVVWNLQGYYVRMAANLIDRGILSPDGEVLKTAAEVQEAQEAQ